MRIAAIDLGSNTSILLIADVVSDRIERVIHDEVVVTRMGAGVARSGKLAAESLARVDGALARFASRIREYQCTRALAVATSAARDARNSGELIGLGRAHGLYVHVITGAREAELTYAGAIGGLKMPDPVVVDIGGGSTEIIARREQLMIGVSVDVGSVRAFEKFITTDPVDRRELLRLREYTERAFDGEALPVSHGSVIAVAGTATALATLDQGATFEEARVHGYRLTRERVDHWAERLAMLSRAERAGLVGMPAERADVSVCGTEILRAAMRALRCAEVTISTRGVRYGLALNHHQFVC